MSRINKESIDRFYDYDIYPETRTVYMGSVSTNSDDGETGTDYAMAERTIKGLHILDSAAPKGDQPITIIMNNSGGDEYHGMAIFDAIKACKNHVTIIVMGHAMSMGSIILQAADKRIMTPNSRMMIHYGTWGITDHPKITYKWAEEGKKFDAWMENTYLEKIKKVNPTFSKKKIEEMCNFDTFLTAQEALELGLIDEILTVELDD
jgi:ATP-dependent Clp protease protease subunit